MGYTVDERFEKIAAANLKKDKNKYATQAQGAKLFG